MGDHWPRGRRSDARADKDRTTDGRSTAGGRRRAPSSHQTSVTKPRRAASNEGRSRLGDLTRPIARENAITRRWSSTVVFSVIAGTIALALVLSLFVLPVRTWLQQSDDLEGKQAQLDELESINDDLEAQVGKLKTAAGAEEAIRKELGMIGLGEERLTMLEPPMLPSKLPKGWPYSAVTGIFEVRSQQQAGTANDG